VGNDPDNRLLYFFATNLPELLLGARAAFDQAKGVMLEYAEERMSYEDFKRAIPHSAEEEEEE
jgi:hypothetical protein